MHVLNVFLRLLHAQPGFGEFLRGDGNVCLVGSGVGRDILLQLGKVAARFVERQQILLRIDRAHQVFLAHIHLRPPDVKFRLQ